MFGTRKFQLNSSFVNEHIKQYILFFLFKYTTKQQICNNALSEITGANPKLDLVFIKLSKWVFANSYNSIFYFFLQILPNRTLQHIEHVY